MTRLQRCSNKTEVVLGSELGRGGEGAVYLVDGAPESVAKIYRRPPSASKIEKLRAMARHVSPELLRVAAWPTDLLEDDGPVLGFLMPRVGARFDVHELYSPKSRRRRFPSADFRFVVRAATNLARAFAQVHAVGHVIGDVNHGNALIGADGTVMLIDCDSFQVSYQDANFDCDVGTPLFTPPELQGQAFRGLRRTAEHDAFGLGLLIFHFLYLGRHPFAGRYVDGEMPIERAIADGRFAYGAHSAALGMSAPPGTLSLDVFGADIASMFEQAFVLTTSVQRPSAGQWVVALRELESRLRVCAQSSAHFHPRAHPCCWCDVEERVGVRVYGTEAHVTISVMVAELWDAIVAAPRPTPAPPPPTLPALDRPEEIDVRVAGRHIKQMLGVFAGAAASAVLWPAFIELAGTAVVIGGGFVAVRYAERRKEIQKAALELKRVLDDWNADCSDAPFVDEMARLAEIKESLLKVARRRAQRLAELPDLETQRQRAEYLDAYAIRDAALPRIASGVLLPSVTDGLLSTLASYGVETAEDVLRMPETLAYVVGEEWAARLRAWAAAHDSNFHVDGEQLLRASNDEDTKLQTKQADLVRELRAGPYRLRVARALVDRRRNDAEQRFIEARRTLMLARSEPVT